MRWGLGGLLRAFFAAPALMFRLAPLEHGHYARSWRRLAALERWLDLAVRPDPAEFPEDVGAGEAKPWVRQKEGSPKMACQGRFQSTTRDFLGTPFRGNPALGGTPVNPAVDVVGVLFL